MSEVDLNKINQDTYLNSMKLGDADSREVEFEKPGFIQKIVSFIQSLLSKFFQIEESICKPLDDRVSIRTEENPRLEIDSSSSIIFNKSSGEYIYISKAPPVKNLVISGGGAKGVILPGVIKAFEEHQTNELSFREQLDHVAGSSIGAVTSIFFAIGMSADDIIEATSKVEFKDLMGKGFGPLNKDGKPLLDFIRKNIQQTVAGHLMKMLDVKQLNEITDVKEMFKTYLKSQNKEVEPDELDKMAATISDLLDVLKQEDVEKICVTFAMLKCLRALEPKVFKDLTVTATCCETGKTFYFDAERTPNLDIGLACRASASLPVILTSVKIDQKFLSPGYLDTGHQVLTFVDGGYLDNIPVQSVHHKQGDGMDHLGDEGQNLQTLVLVFDETKRTENEQSPFHEVKTRKHALYNSCSIIDWLLRDIFARIFGRIQTSERNTVTKENRLEEVRLNYTQRSIPLLVSIKTSDFEKAKKYEKEYVQKGYLQGMAYLVNHEEELMYRTFSSFEDLMEAIPQTVKDAKREEFSKFCAHGGVDLQGTADNPSEAAIP